MGRGAEESQKDRIEIRNFAVVFLTCITWILQICRSPFPNLVERLEWRTNNMKYDTIYKNYIHDQRKDIYFSNNDNYRNWNDCTITKYTKRSEERRVRLYQVSMTGVSWVLMLSKKRSTHNYGYDWCQDEHRSWYIILKISWILQNVISTGISYYTSLGKNKRSQWSTISKAYSVDNRLTIMTTFDYSCQSISAMSNWMEERKLKSEVTIIFFRFGKDKGHVCIGSIIAGILHECLKMIINYLIRKLRSFDRHVLRVWLANRDMQLKRKSNDRYLKSRHTGSCRLRSAKTYYDFTRQKSDSSWNILYRWTSIVSRWSRNEERESSDKIVNLLGEWA